MLTTAHCSVYFYLLKSSIPLQVFYSANPPYKADLLLPNKWWKVGTHWFQRRAHGTCRCLLYDLDTVQVEEVSDCFHKWQLETASIWNISSDFVRFCLYSQVFFTHTGQKHQQCSFNCSLTFTCEGDRCLFSAVCLSFLLIVGEKSELCGFLCFCFVCFSSSSFSKSEKWPQTEAEALSKGDNVGAFSLCLFQTVSWCSRVWFYWLWPCWPPYVSMSSSTSGASPLPAEVNLNVSQMLFLFQIVAFKYV